MDPQLPDATTPLILAASEGHTAVVDALLARGANAAHTNSGGFTASQAARHMKHEALANRIGDFVGIATVGSGGSGGGGSAVRGLRTEL